MLLASGLHHVARAQGLLGDRVGSALLGEDPLTSVTSVHAAQCEAVGAVLEGLWPGEGRYRPNAYCRYAYPED